MNLIILSDEQRDDLAQLAQHHLRETEKNWKPGIARAQAMLDTLLSPGAIFRQVDDSECGLCGQPIGARPLPFNSPAVIEAVRAKKYPESQRDDYAMGFNRGIESAAGLLSEGLK